MCITSDAMFDEKRRSSSRHRHRSASARGLRGDGAGMGGGHGHRGNSLGRSARSAGGSHSLRKNSAERFNGRHSARHHKSRSSKEYGDTPVPGQRKGFSLRLSRSAGTDSHRPANKGSHRFHNIPNVQSDRRGRSVTPKRQTSVGKEPHAGHKGLAGRLRSLSKKVLGKHIHSDPKSSRRHERAPSLQPHEIRRSIPLGLGGHKPKRKRGKSLPSRIANLRRNRHDADSAILRENLGVTSSSTGMNWASSGSVWTEDMSRGDETFDRKEHRHRQRQSASAGRRGRVNSISSRGSDERLRSVKQQPQASKRRSRSKGLMGRGAADQRRPKPSRHDKPGSRPRDQQAALNDLCREHFGVSNKKSSRRKKKHHRKSHHHRHREREEKNRSKSMPPIGGFRNIHVDPEEMLRRPISPVASVDSSWRYKRLRQKLRAKERRKSIEEAEEKRVRSKSCEPSYDFMAVRRDQSPAGVASDPQRSSDEELGEEEEMDPGALVPFVNEQSAVSLVNGDYVNYTLAYNLGEIDGAFIFGEEEDANVEEDEASLPGPSHSDEENTEHEPAATCLNSRSNSPELNKKLERKPSTGHESASKSGTFTSETIGSGTWRGRMPDPVSSLHGDTTVLSPEGTYDNTLMSPRSGTLRSGAHADPPRGEPLTYKTDPPVTARAASPDSFIEVASGKSEGSKEVEDEQKSQDEFEPISRDVVLYESSYSSNSDDGSEEGSLFEYAPSTTGTMEQKVSAKSAAPPLHSAIRAKKPTCSVASSHKPRRKKRSKESKAKTSAEVSKIDDIEAEQLPDNDVGDHDNDLEECYPQHRSRNKTIKDRISEIVVEDENDQVSAITMPPALMMTPPLHARIRAKKPRTRGGLSSHRENKDEEEFDEDAGPLTGNEIDLHSNSTKEPVSEITMPVALHPSFSKGLQSPRQPASLPEEEPVVPHLRPPEENQERPHQNPGAGLASPQKASPSPRPRKVPPPPPRPVPPPPLRSQRSGDSGTNNVGSVAVQQSAENSVVLEDAAAQLLFVQSGSNWALPKTSHEESSWGQQPAPPHRPTNSDNPNLPGHMKRVVNMPYADEYHDMGMYSGETNDYGVPHGRGRMKYDDGETLEGKWVNGMWCGPDAAQRLSSDLSAFKGGPQTRKGSTTSKQSARA